MQRRISRYINSGLLNARLKLTGINSSSQKSGTIEIRAIDSRYFQLSISSESHETHARFYSRFVRTVSAVASPPESRCGRYRVTVFRESHTPHIPPFSPESRKGEFRRRRIGSTLWRHGKRGYRGPAARDRRSGSDSAPRLSPIYLSRKLLRIFFTK